MQDETLAASDFQQFGATNHTDKLSQGHAHLLATPGIQAFAPDRSDGRPVIKVSFLAMELLGPTCWQTVNTMRAQQDILEEDSSDWSEEESDSQSADRAPVRVPSTDWIVKTGKGMLKASQSALRAYPECAGLTQSCCPATVAVLALLVCATTLAS